MSTSRSLWLESHLLADPAGAAAHQEAVALGPAAHRVLLAAGDRLAGVSAVLAQQYYLHAAMAWRLFGADGFQRWISLGEELATVEPTCREGSIAYFAAAPSAFGQEPLETAAEWWRLGRELAASSPRLGGVFFKTTAQVLRKQGGLGRLHTWVEVGRSLYHQHGWKGEFLARAFLASAPLAVSVLSPRSYRLWAGAGAALYPAVKEQEFFGKVPRELRRWPEPDQGLFLRTTLALAAATPRDAYTFYRELPVSVARLSAAARNLLLRVLARAGKRVAGTIADVAPVAGALLRQVPADHVLDALAQTEAVARECPGAGVAALRSLPRLYEEADPIQVHQWFATGVALARENAQAGLAYFALESRTSLKTLRASSTAASLEDVQGLLRKYVHMLSGQPAALRGATGVLLRLPLEECPGEREIALPVCVDQMTTYEDNLRLYRFLAAQLAGRRELGTYELVFPDGAAPSDGPPGSALVRYLNESPHPELLEDLFLVAEGIRIHHQLCMSYRGLNGEGHWVASRLLGRWARGKPAHRSMHLDALFAIALLEDDRCERPDWLTEETVQLVRVLVAPLTRPDATVRDSIRAAEALTAALISTDSTHGRWGGEMDGVLLEKVAGDALLDPYLDERGGPAEREAPRVDVCGRGRKPADAPVEQPIELANGLDDGLGGGQPVSAEELKRLLEAGADVRVTQGSGSDVDGLGLYITDLIGKIPPEQIEALRQLLGDPEDAPRRPKRWLDSPINGTFFWYDEWDYHIGDYRSRWCRLHEVSLDGDSGEFFNQALMDYSRVIPEVRRQFQRIRPEMYRTVRGLEDGEDFDLNAVIDARVDARAGLAPSDRLYVARKREERDVATLFLVDMSASTDEPLVKPATGDGQDGEPPAVLRGRGAWRAPRRVIDVTKETLVIMAEALEEIGDAYAVYGFSGHGRENVEVYRVKSFAEPLNAAVKSRLGGIEPKRSTRMGAALRHAVGKMAAVTSRCKHLFLLSDGFPQDYDYGQDRRSNVYGIRDTAAALREAEAAGITPFCITVDKAGHDYLRQMCDESRYMVIEDISALPRELPKIYQRVVRA